MEVDLACQRATQLLRSHAALVDGAWGTLGEIAVAVNADLGDLLCGEGPTCAALRSMSAVEALPRLVGTIGHWQRSLERAARSRAAERDGGAATRGFPEEKGGGPLAVGASAAPSAGAQQRHKRRRRFAVDALLALVDGLGASAFAATVLGSGFATPGDLARLGAASAAFGGRLPFGVAGERPWLSLAEAATRRLALVYVRPSLRPAVRALPLSAACGRAFGDKKLRDAISARSGRLVAWREALRVGDRLDVMDNDSKRAANGDRGRWCEAELVGHAPPPTGRSRTRALWKVHFRGWDAKFDEFIFAEHAERFRPAFTMVRNWREKLAEGDEVEVRRPRDFNAPRTFWFQGIVVGREENMVVLRLQVIDASLAASVDEPWSVHVDSERIAMKYEHISPDLWQNLR